MIKTNKQRFERIKLILKTVELDYKNCEHKTILLSGFQAIQKELNILKNDVVYV